MDNRRRVLGLQSEPCLCALNVQLHVLISCAAIVSMRALSMRDASVTFIAGETHLTGKQEACVISGIAVGRACGYQYGNDDLVITLGPHVESCKC